MNGVAKPAGGGRPRRRLAWILPVLLASGPAAALAEATWFTIDCPGSVRTEPRGINERGDIVGICEDADGEHGFLLRHGHYTLIDFPGAEGSTAAFGINNRGDVVGRYGIDGVAHGYRLRNGTFTTVDVPGSTATAPFGTNTLGRVVGGYLDGPHAFLLKNAEYTTIDPPGATGAQAHGINVLGRIVGVWTDDPACTDCFTRAFLLGPREFQELQFPGALETVAYGINAPGQIVGMYFGEDEVFHGFLRIPDLGGD